jgi:hypothetical protein
LTKAQIFVEFPQPHTVALSTMKYSDMSLLLSTSAMENWRNQWSISDFWMKNASNGELLRNPNTSIKNSSEVC